MEKRHTHHQFITAGGTAVRPKYTTRHLAALDFLLHIPMKNEEVIRRNGIIIASNLRNLEENDENQNNFVDLQEEDESKRSNQPSSYPAYPSVDIAASPYADYAGKKLQGPHCFTVRVPNYFRHNLQKLTEQGAIVRQWEDSLLGKSPYSSDAVNTAEKSVLSSRMYFSRTHGYPMAVCSVVKYDAGEEKARLEKMKAEVISCILTN